ncbi:hypothetical protein AB0J37_03290 [Microbispora rosea]|uniref:hypothetical protein n=1 Tax=Microbispora rosea TaxID=58117 RepID=UPI0034246529
MISPELTRFIAGLPKAELHVHHVGAASPRIVAELAARHEGLTPVPAARWSRRSTTSACRSTCRWWTW